MSLNQGRGTNRNSVYPLTFTSSHFSLNPGPDPLYLTILLFCLPATFVFTPVIQLSTSFPNTPTAHSCTCNVQASLPSLVASTTTILLLTAYSMKSATHPTAYSIDRGMLPNIWCGPMITRRSQCSYQMPYAINFDLLNMFGKPSTVSPKNVFMPSAHFSVSFLPPIPRISTLLNDPVIASKPVA